MSEEPLRLPPPPDRPDCCAGGCAICVLEAYTEALAEWHAECERIADAAAGRTTASDDAL